VTEPARDPAAHAATVDVLPSDGPTIAVVLVLPGGKANSFEPGDPTKLSAVRMRPFASILHRRGRAHGLAVWTVRYRFRGWNGDERSPVVDAQWALEEVRRHHGDVPVAVIGHSMGGRTALAIGGDPSTRGVCALAPWTEAGDPVDQLAGVTVLIAHGNLDMVTSPKASRQYAVRAARAGARVGYIVVAGDLHAMLFRWRRWHRLATGFSLGVLGIAPMPRRIERALDRGVQPAGPTSSSSS
jgi:alpha-beta hydrolase superfamily lysophospholipase